MLRFERIWDDENRFLVFTISIVAAAAIALADWWIAPYVSLGFLYLFPIMLASAFLPRWAIVGAGIGAAVLSDAFSPLEKSAVRFGFEALALMGSGLFVAELVRNRRLSLELQATLRGLVETSPAAIVTVDERGFIELANRAAVELLVPRDGTLIGTPVAAYVPALHHAMRDGEAPQFRASMQCHAHRGNGETFMAEVWFSTYKRGKSSKLAAIFTEVEEPSGGPVSPNPAVPSERILLNNRELEVLRLLVQGLANKEIASRLEISESGVKNTLQQLFAKTGVRTRSQLVRVAVEDYRDLL
ncbi:MAG TPA: LuxR C-terminal-related transcriptional regulator [Bryobacteraceae bacterium]|nr:LuxR C-terminal-related transcriptional regulator [Bryobacteraceae bacterium]